jgi:hypothetical protein
MTNQEFYNWYQSHYSHGYGTGEVHIVWSLKRFVEAIPLDEAYNYEDIEAKVGPVVAWMFIDVFCQDNLLEYGSSPRYAWLTESGVDLAQFVRSKDATELYDIVTRAPDNALG